ncbi:MAG: hypothetical protein P4L03_02140 [Terracidiphilus sp.]|nr:hypothetical protein [Terracidiphilus sp.]
MKIKHFVYAVLSVVALAGAIILSEPTCTSWMKQTNGTYWRECVDDKGTAKCYSASCPAGVDPAKKVASCTVTVVKCN